MPILVELESDEEQRLRDLAERENRPAEDLCRDAVLVYLKERDLAHPDPFVHLRGIIGIAHGPFDDGSIHHDLRPGEHE